MCFGLSVSLIGCKTSVILNLFSESLLAVEKDNRWGYIDAKGNVKIDFFYDGAGAFRGDVAVVNKNSRYFLIDKNGDRVLRDTYPYLEMDYDTSLLWFITDEGKQGLMNDKGKILAEPIYDLTWGPFSTATFDEGFARLAKDGKFGFINPSGEEVVDFVYDGASDFHQGLAMVRTGGNYGYVNAKGDEVVTLQFADANDYNALKQAIVATTAADDMYQVIDKSGDVVFGGYDNIIDTDYGYVAEQEGQYYLINSRGEKVTETAYDDCYAFFDYFMLYEETGDITYVYGLDLELLLEFPGDESPDNALIDGEKLYFAYYDAEDPVTELRLGTKSWTLDCDKVVEIAGDKIVAEQYGMVGVLTLDNKVFVEFNYDSISPFDDGYYLVEVNNLYGILNERGNKVTEIIYSNCNTTIYS